MISPTISSKENQNCQKDMFTIIDLSEIQYVLYKKNVVGEITFKSPCRGQGDKDRDRDGEELEQKGIKREQEMGTPTRQQERERERGREGERQRKRERKRESGDGEGDGSVGQGGRRFRGLEGARRRGGELVSAPA